MNQQARRPVMIEYMDADEGDFEEGGRGPTEEELAYAQFRSEMQDGEKYAKISVYRQPSGSDGRPGQRKMRFLFDCGLDDYEFSQLLSKLRDDYGTGIYRIQARDAKGALLFNRAYEVEAPKNVKPERESFDPSGMLDAVHGMLNDQQDRFEALFARFGSQNQSNGGGMEDTMRQMALMMGMVTQMMGTIRGDAPKSTDALGEMKKFLEFQTMARQLVNDGDGGGSGANKNIHDTLAKTLEVFGPAFMQGMASLQQPAARGHRPRLPNPNHPPTVAVSAPKPSQRPATQPHRETPPMTTPPNAALAAQVSLLLTNAKNGVSPDAMAESVLQMTPEQQTAQLYALVNDPHLLAKLIAVNPEVESYREWFAELATYIASELAPAFEPDLQSAENVNTLDVSGSDDEGADSAGFDDVATHDDDPSTVT